MAKRRAKDIVKYNTHIRKHLMARFNELEATYAEVCRDAKKRGMNIHQSSLSRYMNNPDYEPGGLAQDQIIWLCLRYCVPVYLQVGNYYKLLDNPEEKGLPKGTLIPVKPKYNLDHAEKNIIMYFGDLTNKKGRGFVNDRGLEDGYGSA